MMRFIGGWISLWQRRQLKTQAWKGAWKTLRLFAFPAIIRTFT